MNLDIKKKIGEGYSISYKDGRIYDASGAPVGRVPAEDLPEVKQQIKEAKCPESHGGAEITFHEAQQIVRPYVTF